MKQALVLATVILSTFALMAGTAAAQTIPPQQVTCASFANQAAAQAAYRANPGGLRALDPDGDGIACEDNRAPFDRTPASAAGPAAPDDATRPSAQSAGQPTTQPGAAAVQRPGALPTQQPGTLPQTGGGPIGALAATTLAILSIGLSLRRMWR